MKKVLKKALVVVVGVFVGLMIVGALILNHKTDNSFTVQKLQGNDNVVLTNNVKHGQEYAVRVKGSNGVSYSLNYYETPGEVVTIFKSKNSLINRKAPKHYTLKVSKVSKQGTKNEFKAPYKVSDGIKSTTKTIKK